MSRKLFFVVTFFFVFAFIIIAFDHPASASISKQEENPPERVRPDQFAYHGKEELLHLATQDSPVMDSITIDSPVEQWSKMTFESYIDNNWEIYYASGSFTNLVRLTNNNTSDIHPRLNRGASRIAFASYRDGSDYEIYTMNTDGSNLVRLTNNSTDDVKPVWSPDGTKIAFQSYRDGNAEVYVMNADGSGLTRLTYSGDYNGEPTWSPDGSHIAFTSSRNNIWRIWVMDANGANQAQLSQQPYSESPVWSPDGTQIVYDADQDGDGWQEIWTMNSNGSNQVMRGDPPYYTTYWANGWSPDSEYLTYTSVHMVYVYGNWYWDYARLYKKVPGSSAYVINSGRDTDWYLDWTTMDNQPPRTSMSAPISPVPYQFTISWSGQDNLSGISSYDVQVRDGPSGTWTDWQSHTTETSALYTGIGGHEYYFRTRARDQAFNLQSWPASYQTYSTVEAFPPITQVNELLPYTRGENVLVSWGGQDIGGSGIQDYDVQVMDISCGIWEDWLTGVTITNSTFLGELGHTYSFRSRSVDNAQNVENWPFGDGDTTTTLFSWRIKGKAEDNTGIPISGMDISTNPTAFQSFASDLNGKYSTYLAVEPTIETIIWSKNEYGSLPPTDFGILDADVNVVLSPADNIVQDWDFESGFLPGAWTIGGDYSPTLTNTMHHSGNYASLFGPSWSFSAPVTLGPVIYDSIKPMVIDDAGTAHFVWRSHENPYTINYINRQSDGTWSALQIITDSPQHGLIYVAVDHYLIVHVIWDEYSSVYHSWRDLDGNWSAPYLVMTTPAVAARVVLMDSDQANILHVMIADNDGIGYYAQSSGGDNWSIEEILSTHDLCNQADWEIDQAGNIYIVWSGMYGGLRYIYRDNTLGWSDEVVVSSSYAANPDIEIDSKNIPHVIWIKELEYLLYSKMVNSSTWSLPISLTDGLEIWDHPILLIDSKDGLNIIFGRQSGGFETREIQYLNKKMEEDWSFPVIIAPPGEVGLDLWAEQDNSGIIYVIWAGFPDPVDRYKYFSQFRNNEWSSPRIISDTPSGSYDYYFVVNNRSGIQGVFSENSNGVNTLNYFDCQPLSQSGASFISQSLTIPVSMTNPTLSFLTSLSGISDISGNEFLVQVTDAISTTTLFSSITPTAWQHYWFDLTPWSGQPITLTFQLTENAGYPPASALLDEVSLGAAHTDVWVDLTGGLAFAPPGEQFAFQLAYGNRSAIPASTSVITLFLPLGLNFISASLPPTVIGNQLVWQVGDLPPGSTFDPISITVQVDGSIPPIQNVVTNVSITTLSPEIETLNNTSHFDTYLGYVELLPIILK